MRWPDWPTIMAGVLLGLFGAGALIMAAIALGGALEGLAR